MSHVFKWLVIYHKMTQVICVYVQSAVILIEMFIKNDKFIVWQSSLLLFCTIYLVSNMPRAVDRKDMEYKHYDI